MFQGSLEIFEGFTSASKACISYDKSCFNLDSFEGNKKQLMSDFLFHWK